MNPKRNKFLTEAMGLCWHKWIAHEAMGHFQCAKCGKMEMGFSCKEEEYHSDIDFSTWEGFGKLWQWANEQEWWDDFTDKNYHCCRTDLDMINPNRFSHMLYEYLEEKDE
jgi:hypothetical protein